MPDDVAKSEQDHWLNRPLAIVGMACRLPGAANLDAYWELLRSGGYAIERMPDSKLNRRRYFDSRKGQRGKTYSEIGGFVSARDPQRSSLLLDPTEVADWDECHLNLCEVAAEACLHAGYDPRRLAIRNTGVFVGHSGGSTLGGELAYRTLVEDYVKLLDDLPTWESFTDRKEIQDELLERMQAGRPVRQGGKPFVDASCAAGLISRCLGLTGPHMSIDAACASSLVALALGANSLHAGQTEMAIIGGASFNKTDSLILFSNAQSCSATASRPFDQAADGLISSEGYVTILIKTLDRAEADGDTIHAVIRGIGVASDGRGRSLWAPRKEGQYAAIQRAYSANVRPDSVQMIEAHATSTQVGDATEMEALASFYGEHLPEGTKLPVGSVKSNIGHTLETAGLAGLVKSVLSIQNATIPPSVNVVQLTDSIPWSDIPLYVARESLAWPQLPVGVPRRAAVNAFGIGGLNVHVVVDQYLGHPSLSGRVKPTVNLRESFEPIAVVGRGLVVPGAMNVDEFRELLGSRASQLVLPPSERVRCGDAYLRKCGYITDFQYDWRKHKVPPKQIAQANPLQFMLLEAAEQALREAKMLEREFDRRHTAVVVGSPFGGDFGNALFAGLRLPEFREHLLDLLERREVDGGLARDVVAEYDDHFLQMFPALLDETGSFTSSTLASRLSKTFDLMGGAMAIDAGDTSGTAAVSSACGLLHSGAVSHVLCAAAHRALDRAAIQNLVQLGRLPAMDSAMENGLAVGEGVALLLLKRHKDAVRDGNQVFTTITHACAGFSARSLTESLMHAVACMDRIGTDRSGPDRQGPRFGKVVGALGVSTIDTCLETALAPSGVGILQSANIKSTGYLQATQGVVDIIAESLSEKQSLPSLLASHTSSGQSYLVETCTGKCLPLGAPEELDHASNQNGAKVTGRVDSEIFRFSADTCEGLSYVLGQLADSASMVERQPRVTDKSMWRAAIVCRGSELAGKAQMLANQIGNEKALQPLAEQGMFWASPEAKGARWPAKVAWLFPGQGSQATGMLKELTQDNPIAAKALREANESLHAMGQPTFEAMAWDHSAGLGEDVWLTQATMLVADWVLLQTLRSHGVRPDLVSGHSFGEFAAMLAAGCWNLADALQATWHRCRSIIEHVPVDCAMLSIQADRQTTQAAIDAAGLVLSVSHVNTPRQTVVGGKRAVVARLADIMEEEGIASRILAVPTAFHTPFLEAARQPFRDALGSIQVEPPSVAFLSNVSNQYVAEPMLMRSLLADQLVSPLNFVGLVERLVQDGVKLVIEVGPSQVLSRLVRQITDRLVVVPTEHPKRAACDQLLCARAVMELHGHNTECATDGGRLRSPSQDISSTDATEQFVAPVHFDATTVRRDRLRQASGCFAESGKPGQGRAVEVKESVHFDATSGRRAAHRAGTKQLSAAATASEVPFQPGVNQDLTKTPTLALATPQAQAQAQPLSSVDALGGINGSNEPASDTSKSTRMIERFLIDFVVEQTGYPAEIIELQWDIEADLGIDSIKKAQLFGELREFFELEVHAGLNLDHFRTLRDIVDLLERTPGKGEWLAESESGSEIAPGSEIEPVGERKPTAESQPAEGSKVDFVANRSAAVLETRFAADTPAEPATRRAAGRAVDREAELTKFLVDFVVEQTGYPPEIVELDADLEADLGIDSIKRAQLLGELREMFDLQVSAVSPAKTDGDVQPGQQRGGLIDFRTLRDVLKVLVENGSDSDASDASDVNRAATGEADLLAEASTSPAWRVDAPDASGFDDASAETSGLRSGDSASVSSQRQVEQFLPSVEITSDDEVVHSDAFCTAASMHYVALTRRCREEDMRSAGVCADAVANWHEAVGRRLASACGVPPQTVFAFDRALQVQSAWRRVDASETHETEAGNLLWLAELAVPGWLSASAGELLGLMRVRNDERATATWEHVIVPGAIVPMASLRDRTLLLVGGIVDPQPADAGSMLALSKYLQRAKGVNLEEILGSVRELELTADWWFLAADAVARRQVLVEVKRGMMVIEKTSLDSTGTRISAIQQASARIGIDLGNGEFVLESQQRPRPFAPLQFRFSRENENHSFSTSSDGTVQALDAKSTESRVAARYVLRMTPAPAKSAPGRQPTWCGAALIVGDNAVARQLEARLRSAGVQAIRVPGSEDDQQLARHFELLVQTQMIPHLFITTPWDSDAGITLDAETWRVRRSKGIMGNFWLCQKWLAHVIERGVTDDASLVAVTSLGGDFGISGNLVSAEGGGLAGLLKSMLIESWTHGYRPLPIKILDCGPEQSPAEIVGNIWQELAVPSYDFEVAYRSGIRQVVRAIPTPLPLNTQAPSTQASSTHASGTTMIRRGGTWVCTGGARGITAYAAEQLARRCSLKLHLLGTAPSPAIRPEWRSLDEAGLRALKVRVMTEARDAGKSPVQAWQETEKALEIDGTLLRLAEAGIEAYYHSCDVANRASVQSVLQRVRELSGPIHGVLHGAGVGKDSRFDRKQAVKVEQCIAAKVDGAFSLIEATWGDPLEHFVGFGSISGRFGANGHTDYSLANEMLCKQIDWLKRQRPLVKAVGFHWHAWGDVGMATKPETRLALEMIDMQFMPAAEGIEHLIGELEGQADESEVLITDDRYYRMFFPAETLVHGGSRRMAGSELQTPFLAQRVTPQCGGERAFTTLVDPVRDPFLAEHLLDGKPLLPFVIAAEMLWESASAHMCSTRVKLFDLEATGALRFFGDAKQELRLETIAGEQGQVTCSLYSDFRSRSGRLVEANRLHFTAVGCMDQAEVEGSTRILLDQLDGQWTRVNYPAIDSKFYVGWPLQRLRKVTLVDRGLVGKISAPALIELAGTKRDLAGWRIPSAAMDACLFATGILAWQQVAPGAALPVRIGCLSVGRLPVPGEACEVHVRLNSASDGRAAFDFTLYGVDGVPILDARDYQVAWLQASVASLNVSTSNAENAD